MMTVMIVDDETIAREGLRDLVDWKALDMEVTALAANGQEALDRLLEHPVDILLTDIKMPRMDGLDLLKALSERSILPTCIILSGFNEFQYAQKAIQYGVISYLLKPIHINELMEALQKAAELRRQNLPASDPADNQRFRQRARAEANRITELIGHAICVGEEASVRAECEQLRQLFREGGYSDETFRRYAFSCVFELARAVGQFTGEEAPLMDDSDRMTFLTAAQGEPAIYSALLQCVDDLCGHVHALRQSGRRRVVNDLAMMVQKRYGEEGLALAQLAEELGLTPNYLSALFRREMKKTFSEYLEEYRMERAVALMGDARMKVYEVAASVGYSDPRHFAKVFKEHTGKTPLHYRNQFEAEREKD